MKITTQKQVETVPAKGTPYALGGNLYLDVRGATSRAWTFIWKVGGRNRYAGLGSACGAKGHKVTLVEARRKADAYRALVADGKDPVEEQRRETTLLGAYAEAYIDKIKDTFRNPKTEQNWRRSFRQHAASLASEPVAALTTAKIKPVVERYWLSQPETARHLRRRLESVLRAAKADGLRTGDNPASLENLGLPKHRKKGNVRHHPALPYEQLPAFMATLAEREAEGRVGMVALQLLILTATRTAETLFAEWKEFDLAARQWTIPAHRVKNGSQHVVPLTDAMLAVLRRIPKRNADDRLFGYGRNALRSALKRIPGCADITVHGFRSTFRDWCGNETAFAREIVEETYGHDPLKDDAERAYRRQKALKKRRQVLEAWNGYAMQSGKVVRLRRAS